jgi:PBP1b-binding outer membrane lipoprotein LpoB
MFKNILLIVGFAFIINGCFGSTEEEKWTAFIYPNKEDTTQNIKSPMTFSSLEECKKVSILEIKKQNLENIAMFKCGLNCRYNDGMKKEICQKMLSSTDK